MERDMPKFNLMNIVAGIVTVLTMIGAVLAADARYTKQDDLQAVKNEIINEMRTEISKNRAVMIGSMQRDADDLEFMMMEFEQDDKKVPRYIIEKHKQITRQIDELQEVGKE